MARLFHDLVVGGLNVKARRYALGFFWSGWRDYSMISMGGGLKVKAHRRCAAHRAFFILARSNCVWTRRIKKARRYALGFFLVGMARFELTTPCTPCKCATGLRYIPIFYVGNPTKSRLLINW